MVTPAPGWIVDPNNPNGVIQDPNAQVQPGGAATTQPQQPQPQPAPAPAPVQQTTQPQTTQPQTQSSTAPTTNLQPGAQGQDVQALQNYLVQQGYLTAQQVATGPGIYGPQTTAAVAKMQQDLGVNAGTAAGDYGPQTQAALQQKYQNLYNQNQGSQAPLDAAQASTALQTPQSSDPVFNSMLTSMAPIMDSLNQVMQNINNPALTGVSLQQEYNQLQQQYQLPQMNAQLMNMQNVMNGTQQDIRDEITSAGGLATDSQVLGMTSARNTVILKQYNALSTQYQAATTNVNNMMQYATSDQQTQLAREQATAGVAGQMATIYSNMENMAMTMQQNAVSAAQYNISQTGYQAFASTLQGNPPMQSYYENLLNLAPGTLSNPTALAALDTYKEQSLQLTNTLRGVQLYNATGDASYLPTGLTPATAPALYSPTGSTSALQQYGTATSTISQATGYAPTTPITQVDPNTLLPAIIANEGGSLPGVQDNPGNIKYEGLPGQTNSGVAAADGGTFASYATPDSGKQAVLADIQAGMVNNPNQTLGQFIDKYTNTAPQYNAVAGAILPKPSPTTPGTNANNVNDLVNPATTGANQNLLQAAGLNASNGYLIFSMLTGNTSAYTRMSQGQKTALVNATTQWLLKHNNVDIGTFQSQYNAYNTTLGGNIQRYNATKIQENELLGTIGNLQQSTSQAGLGGFVPANVAALYAGQQVNDSAVTQYSTQLLSMQNELAGYLAASRGNLSASGGPSPDQSDMTEAANVITNGIGQGGISGFKSAIQSQTTKMNSVLATSVDTAQQNVWQLFGVGQDYVPPTAKGSLSNSQFVAQSFQTAGVNYNSFISGASSAKDANGDPIPGAIGVVDNSTGELGYIPVQEFDPTKYTKA